MGNTFLPFSAFGGRLIRWNGLDAAGFAAWDFLPGMRFGEFASWWRDGTARDAPHEGLDIGWYRSGDGRRLALGAGARVPVLWAGAVVAVVPDFLGASVFVAHDRADCEGRLLHTVYGHVEPRAGLAPGARLGDEDLVGSIVAPVGARVAVPPHLHLTVALIDRAGGPERLDWGAMRAATRVLLLDPLPILCGTMPDDENRATWGGKGTHALT